MHKGTKNMKNANVEIKIILKSSISDTVYGKYLRSKSLVYSGTYKAGLGA